MKIKLVCLIISIVALTLMAYTTVEWSRTNSITVTVATPVPSQITVGHVLIVCGVASLIVGVAMWKKEKEVVF